MPMTPAADESQDDFMQRCTAHLTDDMGESDSDAEDMCLNMYRESKGLEPIVRPLPIVYLDPK